VILNFGALSGSSELAYNLSLGMAFGIESAIETCFAGSRAPSWTSNRGGIAGAGRREPRVEAGNCCLP